MKISYEKLFRAHVKKRGFMNLEHARIKRQENAFAKLYNHNGETLTLETYVQRKLDSGYKLATGQESAIQFNRVKFNCMNQKEQDVYNKRLAQTKIFYRIENIDGNCFDLPKVVYDYFLDKEKGLLNEN